MLQARRGRSTNMGLQFPFCKQSQFAWTIGNLSVPLRKSLPQSFCRRSRRGSQLGQVAVTGVTDWWNHHRYHARADARIIGCGLESTLVRTSVSTRSATWSSAVASVPGPAIRQSPATTDSASGASSTPDPTPGHSGMCTSERGRGRCALHPDHVLRQTCPLRLPLHPPMPSEERDASRRRGIRSRRAKERDASGLWPHPSRVGPRRPRCRPLAPQPTPATSTTRPPNSSSSAP